MAKRVTGTTFHRATFVKRGAVRNPNNPSEPFGRLIWKADDEPADNRDASVPSPAPGGVPMTATQLQEALAKAEKDRDDALRKAREAEEKLAEASKKDDEDDDSKKGEPGRNSKGEFEKSELPEPVRIALEKAEKEAADLRKAADEARDLAKAERDLRVEREFIAKAETEFSHLGKAEELGPELMRMEAALSKADYESHLQRLAAANEQIAKGDLFKEMGVAARGSRGDSADTLLQKAQELRKADPALSQYEAFEQARRANPDAQARHLAGAR